MFYRQKENKIISKILDHSGGVFSSGHGWGILGGRQGLSRAIFHLLSLFSVMI
jgi:hypothetical protein